MASCLSRDTLSSLVDKINLTLIGWQRERLPSTTNALSTRIPVNVVQYKTLLARPVFGICRISLTLISLFGMGRPRSIVRTRWSRVEVCDGEVSKRIDCVTLTCPLDSLLKVDRQVIVMPTFCLSLYSFTEHNHLVVGRPSGRVSSWAGVQSIKTYKRNQSTIVAVDRRSQTII